MVRTGRTAGITAIALLGALPAAMAAELYVREDDTGRRIFTNIRKGDEKRFVPTRRSPRVLEHKPVQARLRLSAAAEERRRRFRPMVRAAAARYRLPLPLLEAVIAVESDFDPKARSWAGATGLMQLMPATAAGLGVKDATDPVANVDGGARYLRQLLDRFDQDLTRALAAYHAGPGAVERAGGVPRIPATQRYVKKVRERLGHAVLRDWASTLRSFRDKRGTLTVTNRTGAASDVKVERGADGRRTLTNR